MRILCSFAGGRGHLEPLVPLALAATVAGHEVAVAGGHRPLQSVGELGLELIPLGSPPTGPRERLPLLEVDLERERRDIAERFVRKHTRGTVPEVRALCERWRPDLVLCDEMDYAAMISAALLELPFASVVVTATGAMITPAVVAEALDEVRAEHGLPPDPTLSMLTRHLVLSPFPPSFRDPNHPLPANAASFRAIAAPEPVGEPPWPVRLSGAPVVYFTLGTEFNVESGDLFSRVLVGLSELPLNVVATVGRDLEPEELGPLPEHVHVAQYIPQALVLPHCSAVVSHGGSGSVLGALTHGLPQVLIAMGADQPLNAARCEELGLAVGLDPVRATPAAVREAVSHVLAESSYRAAAARFRAELETLPEPADAVRLLERLVVGDLVTSNGH